MDTHYIFRPPLLNRDTFAAFAADVRKIIDAAPDIILTRGQDGTGVPEVTVDRVAFNGDESRREAHESLVIEQTFTRKPPDRMRDGIHFDFCKTAGKPYDLVVVAVLYALIYRFPHAKFTSDKSPDALRPGFDLFVKAVQPDGDVEDLRQRPSHDRF